MGEELRLSGVRAHSESEGLVENLRYQVNLGGASRPDHIKPVCQELSERESDRGADIERERGEGGERDSNRERLQGRETK